MDNEGENRAPGKKTKRQYSSTETAGAGSKRHCPSPEKTDTNFSIAKNIMTKVDTQLIDQKKNLLKFIDYVRDNISKLDNISKKEAVKKKTTIGVFGPTGAGKSYLINTILGETELLPSGTGFACTSVIIQVEANITDSNYTAEIEFISKEEWRDELKKLLKHVSEDGKRDDSTFRTAKQKIEALYGKQSINKSLEILMKDDNFTSVPAFVKSETQKIECETASELSDEIRSYVQNDTSSPGKCYWPIVKNVTIKVPDCEEFLENVVLVDLPGTGDYNKSRDEMWRSKLRDCSTVWILSNVDRAVSDSNTWEIVSRSIKDMAQGGECRSISFICTKTDDIDTETYMRTKKLKNEDFKITAQDPKYKNKKIQMCILHRNHTIKKEVKESFNEQPTLKKHFICDDKFLSVFTVSSKEFRNDDAILTQDETEIPLLRDLLRNYNKSHTNEMTNDYISGAHGILSLIQGSKESDTEMMAKKTELHNELKMKLEVNHQQLKQYCFYFRSLMTELLSKGAEESEKQCVSTAEEIITNSDGRGFHRTLTALCENGGVYTSKNGETRNLNLNLIKPMQDHIDQPFNELFPVPEKATEKSLHEHIDKFTIITEELIKKYETSPVLHHLLKFLQTVEEKLNTELKWEIIKRKKQIYESLHKSIQTTMQPCYEEAAEISGRLSMQKKQEILKSYIKSKKSEMFQKAKTEMLDELYETMNYTMQKIKQELMKSMEYSLLNASALSTMDVSEEIKNMDALKGSSQHR